NMANAYTKMYIQTIFAVKYRKGQRQKSWKNEFFGVIGNLINGMRCKTMLVNWVEEHVHCLLGLKPDVSVSDLMKSVKARSSKYINDHRLAETQFRWQEGFGAFTYSQSNVDAVFEYIQNQEEHHKKMTFRDEYIGLLEKFNIDYDERYIFDELV